MWDAGRLMSIRRLALRLVAVLLAASLTLPRLNGVRTIVRFPASGNARAMVIANAGAAATDVWNGAVYQAADQAPA